MGLSRENSAKWRFVIPGEAWEFWCLEGGRTKVGVSFFGLESGIPGPTAGKKRCAEVARDSILSRDFIVEPWGRRLDIGQGD
jgi:hypothetical protein